MPSDQVLRIIKSLSSDEAKSFKNLMKAEHGDKQLLFLRLYNQINRLLSQSMSDEEVNKKLQQFLNRNPSIKKNEAKIKKQLEEKLLKSLSINIYTIDTRANISNCISLIKNFIDRKLYNEAMYFINDTKKRAKVYDLNNYLLELTDLELYLMSKQSEKKDVLILNKLIDELNHYQTLYSLELQLKNIFRQLTLTVEKDMKFNELPYNRNIHLIFQQFSFKQFKIDEYKMAENIHIVNWYYRVQNLYHRSIQDFKSAFQFSQSLFEYLDSDPNILKKFESLYIKAICSFTRTCFTYDKKKELEDSLNKTKKLYNNRSNFNALIENCDIGVLYYLNTFQYQKAKEFAILIEKDWEGLTKRNADGKLLWYCRNNMLFYWVLADLEKFQYWLNKGLDISQANKGKVLYFDIRLFELINDFEQQNWHFFYQKVESLKKILQNNNNLNGFEKIVLQHLRTLYNNVQSNKNINLNKDEKAMLQENTFLSLKTALLKSEFTANYNNYEEILLWCESHLQNKTIKAVFEGEK